MRRPPLPYVTAFPPAPYGSRRAAATCTQRLQTPSARAWASCAVIGVSDWSATVSPRPSRARSQRSVWVLSSTHWGSLRPARGPLPLLHPRSAGLRQRGPRRPLPRGRARAHAAGGGERGAAQRAPRGRDRLAARRRLLPPRRGGGRRRLQPRALRGRERRGAGGLRARTRRGRRLGAPRGEWVSYIPGAPEFVNEAFTELFAGGPTARHPPRRAQRRPAPPPLPERAAAAARTTEGWPGAPPRSSTPNSITACTRCGRPRGAPGASARPSPCRSSSWRRTSARAWTSCPRAAQGDSADGRGRGHRRQERQRGHHAGYTH